MITLGARLFVLLWNLKKLIGLLFLATLGLFVGLLDNLFHLKLWAIVVDAAKYVFVLLAFLFAILYDCLLVLFVPPKLTTRLVRTYLAYTNGRQTDPYGVKM